MPGASGIPAPAAIPSFPRDDAVCFGWFTPFFFVTTGIKFDVAASTRSSTTLLLVPSFPAILLLARGAPIFLYLGDTPDSVPLTLWSQGKDEERAEDPLPVMAGRGSGSCPRRVLMSIGR